MRVGLQFKLLQIPFLVLGPSLGPEVLVFPSLLPSSVGWQTTSGCEASGGRGAATASGAEQGWAGQAEAQREQCDVGEAAGGAGLTGQTPVLSRGASLRGQGHPVGLGAREGFWSPTCQLTSLFPWALTTSSEKGGSGPGAGDLIFLAVTLQDVCPEPSCLTRMCFPQLTSVPRRLATCLHSSMWVAS